MHRALIKLSYRQVIDSSSTSSFEQNVFNDSYEEYLMQIQAYNQERKFTTFQQVTEANPKASSLHYKVGFSVGLYINNLDHKIPGLFDSLQQFSISFISHSFEIIDSDITDRTGHRVSILYKTDTLTLLDTIGNHLVLVFGDGSETSGELETFLVKLQPGLSISSYLPF